MYLSHTAALVLVGTLWGGDVPFLTTLRELKEVILHFFVSVLL